MDRTNWKWYKFVGYEGHQGAKKSKEVKLYVFAEDIIHAMSKYKRINRIKPNLGPDVKELSKEESSNLVKEILSCKRPNFTIGVAKRYYYLSNDSYNAIISS